jgi:hypothetical protein
MQFKQTLHRWQQSASNAVEVLVGACAKVEEVATEEMTPDGSLAEVDGDLEVATELMQAARVTATLLEMEGVEGIAECELQAVVPNQMTSVQVAEV